MDGFHAELILRERLDSVCGFFKLASIAAWHAFKVVELHLLSEGQLGGRREGVLLRDERRLLGAVRSSALIRADLASWNQSLLLFHLTRGGSVRDKRARAELSSLVRLDAKVPSDHAHVDGAHGRGLIRAGCWPEAEDAGGQR